MKAVVILLLICACSALPQFFLADTPEVQAEKQRFYQLYNAAAAAAAAAPDIHIYSQQKTPVVYQQQQQPITYQATHRFDTPQHHQVHQTAQYTPKWTGPLAATIPAGLPGSTFQVRNTPEVEAAIADFTRAYNAAVLATRSNVVQTPFGAVHTTYSSAQPQFTTTSQVTQPKWTGPLAATIPAGLPGSTSQVQDTPEVLAAKAQFARAFNQQLAYVAG